MTRQRRLLLLGFGDAGEAIARAATHDVVMATTRRLERARAIEAAGAVPLVARSLDAALLGPLAEGADVVVSFPPDGATDGRVAPALEAARRTVYLSSTAVYGDHRGRVDDRTPVDPSSARAAPRLAAERLYLDRGAVVLRAPGLYGPSSGLHRRLLAGTYRLPGDGRGCISRLHLDDLATLSLAALDGGERGEAYVVGDLSPVPQIEVVAFLCERLNLPLPPSAPLAEVSPTLRGDRRVDPSRALAELGVTLRYPSFREGFSACLAARWRGPSGPDPPRTGAGIRQAALTNEWRAEPPLLADPSRVSVIGGNARASVRMSTAMAHPVAEGDVLADKYRVERVLGKGGMGLVVAAMHLQLKERVALKFLLPAAAQQAEFSVRFQREAQLMAKLRSEHVVRVTDVGVLATGAPYMVMEYLEGTDLREIIRQVRPVPLDVALDYILQACEGVAEAHSYGIVHRDLKPTNLFVTQRRDGSPLVKVLDFGISKALDEEGDDDQLTGVATILGSPKYMPPEQLRSSRNVDARADVWALGAIFQEMLTGDPPFSGPNTTAICAAVVGDPPVPLRRARPDLPDELEAVLLKCFEKDPEARWPNVAELAAELVKASAPDDAEMNLAVDRIARLSAPNSTLLSTTGGRRALNRSGASAQLNRTGSNLTPISLPPTSKPSTTSVTPLAPPSDEPSGGVPVSTGPAAQGGSRRNLVVGAVVLAALAIGGLTVARSRDEAKAPQPATVASAPQAPASAKAELPPAASSSAAPTPAPAASPSASADAAPADTSSRAAPHGDRSSSKDGSSRGKRSSDSGSKASPAATPAPTPTQAPSPTAAPAPPPKEKPLGNPLEDRQ